MLKLCLTIVVLLCVSGAVSTRVLNSEDEEFITPLTFRFQPRYLQQVDTGGSVVCRAHVASFGRSCAFC